MYEKNYIQSINSGLNSASYLINKQQVQSEIFFNEINLLIKKTQKNKGKIYFFGNGASASFSNHMALDWSKNGGVLALSLSDSSMLTALANDYSYNEAFVEFMKINKISIDDLVISTSSSGNSKNIVNVLNYCEENNITSIGLSGLNSGNKTEEIANYSLFVPSKTYGMVECIHQIFHHLILDKFMNIEEWRKIESQNMDAKNFKL
jgi:D-sedoheptulose 7-phosphate isomerase